MVTRIEANRGREHVKNLGLVAIKNVANVTIGNMPCEHLLHLGHGHRLFHLGNGYPTP